MLRSRQNGVGRSGSGQCLTLMLIAIFFISLGYGISFPLLAILLEARGASSYAIGINAAMPALGWLMMIPAMVWLRQRLGVRRAGFGFLLLSVVSWAAIAATDDLALWAGLRFLFGGALGMFYRIIEYWLTTSLPEATRGRQLGIYNATFLGGIIVGSLLQPGIGVGANAFVVAGSGIALGAVMFLVMPVSELAAEQGWRLRSIWQIARRAPLSIVVGCAYGMFETIPAYLLSVFALRHGMGEVVAAQTLAVCALGAMAGAVPMGLLSDQVGRRKAIALGALGGLIGAAVIPFTLTFVPLFLGVLFLWTFMVQGFYGAAIALLADHFDAETRLAASASFGVYYAVAALLGPLLVTLAMDTWPSYGLFAAAAGMFVIVLAFVASPHVHGANNAP